MVEIARRQLGQFRRQFRRRRIGHIDEGIGIGQHPRLLGHDLRHLVAAITHIHAPHAAKPVEIALAVHIRDVTALAFDDDQRAVLLETVEMRPWVQEVVVILLPKVLGIEAISGALQHDILSSFTAGSNSRPGIVLKQAAAGGVIRF